MIIHLGAKWLFKSDHCHAAPTGGQNDLEFPIWAMFVVGWSAIWFSQCPRYSFCLLLQFDRSLYYLNLDIFCPFSAIETVSFYWKTYGVQMICMSSLYPCCQGIGKLQFNCAPVLLTSPGMSWITCLKMLSVKQAKYGQLQDPNDTFYCPQMKMNWCRG